MLTQPQSITIAQARIAAGSGLFVSDTAGNIAAAMSNAALIARIASFTLSAPGGLTVAQVTSLLPIAARLHAAAGALALIGPATLSVAQLIAFETLPGFTAVATGNVNLSYSTSQILAMLASHPAYFMQVSTVTVHLDGTSMGAYPASQLNGLASHGKTLVFISSPGHSTLSIVAAAHDLATNVVSLNALALHQPLSFTVTNDGSPISAMDAIALATLSGFSPAAHILYVSDTGANITSHIGGLLGHGFAQVQVVTGTLGATALQLLDPSVHFGVGAHAQLAANTTVGAIAATLLSALPGFSIATGTTLSIADTAANLALNVNAWLGIASAVSVTADATVSAAAATVLGLISAHLGGWFSLSGHSITVSDTPAALIAMPAPAALLVAISELSAPAIVTVGQLNSLAAEHGFSTAGYSLTVFDTAINLLNLSNNVAPLATAIELSADASVNALQAQILMAGPTFSTGGHLLTIADTAVRLLAMPHSVQIAASLLTLSGDQTVNAATLGQLAALGIKFSEAGHVLICSDTADNLASLPLNALALATTEILISSAIVNTTTAVSLAALTALSLSPGVTLTIQDTVANLIALGHRGPAIAGSESLPAGSVVTVTAAQGVALIGLPHFSSAGSIITVSDTVAHLAAVGTGILPTLTSVVNVNDTAANLFASANTVLVQSATTVTLSGNGQVNALVAAQLATIPHFSVGAYLLTVSDTAASVAANEATIMRVATQVVVTDAGPVTVAAADQLALLSAAGTLSFQGGNPLSVQDTLAALTDYHNATGLLLASRLTVVDSPSNLITASSHNWGSINPTYMLSQPSIISAAQATSLATLGSHFTTNGYQLSVADNATSIINAAASIDALHITGAVTDLAANLGANASGLLAMERSIGQIQTSDTSPVNASTAASVAALAPLLTGPAIIVSDTAFNITAVLSNLVTLVDHISLNIIDTAVNIAPDVSDFSVFHNNVTFTLTDTSPVTAAIASALAPLAPSFMHGTLIAVTDTSAAIVANATALAALAANLGTISLSDGTALSVDAVAALAPLNGHFATGVTFVATGTAADVDLNALALTALQTAGRLTGISVIGTTVIAASTHIAILNTLSVQVSIHDTAAHIGNALDALTRISGLQDVTFTDGGTPAITMTLSTLAADLTTLNKITSSFTISIVDSAAHISADLAAGFSSHLLGYSSEIGQVSTIDGQPIILTQGQILIAGIDSGAGSALATFAGSIQVVGVDVAHVNQIASLSKAPYDISITDTAAAIEADLGLGSASVIVRNNGLVGNVNVTGGLVISLTGAQILAAGIDDGTNSVISRIHGASLTITDATVGQLAAIGTLQLQPTVISVSDTAAHISADLASGASSLVASLLTVGSISVFDGLAISLTEQQVLAVHVDDGPGSVMSELTGGQLTVSQVVASDIAQLLGLEVPPTMLSVNDTAAHVLSNLSGIITNIAEVSAITIIGAPLTLTAAEALASHVDDGAGSIIDRVAGHSFNVTGASVAQISLLLALDDSPSIIGVTDSSANIVADLTSPNSILAADPNSIGLLTVTHGVLNFTDAQAAIVRADTSLSDVMGLLPSATSVVITGVPVSDLANLASSGWPHLAIAVLDSTDNIAADLSGNSSLLANVGFCSGVTLSDDGTVNVATLSAMSALPFFSTGGFDLVVQDGATAMLALSPASLAFAHAINVVDNATNVAADLDLLQSKFLGGLSITLTDSSPTISITTGQYTVDHATISAITSMAVFTVTGSAGTLAGIAHLLVTDSAVNTVVVKDNATNLISNWGELEFTASKLSIMLLDTSITANLVIPLLSIPNINLQLTVVDSGAQIAALAESGNMVAIAYMNSYGAALADSSVVGAADSVALESLTRLSKAGQTLVVWDTAQHLSSPAYASRPANGIVDHIYLKAPGSAISIGATIAATLFGITGFLTTNPDGSTNSITVVDSAAHIDANYNILSQNLGFLTNIVVNANATVTSQTLIDLQALNAVAGNMVHLVVQDTAANILAAVSNHASGQSILPAAWTLLGNETISEAGAVVLAGLAHFDPGPYTISVNLGVDTVISVADANQLGLIAGSLNLPGHHLIVQGTAAQLSSLSSSALRVVSPALIDNIVNILALAVSSPLLAGTVEITGADEITAIAATTLVNLVHSGTGSGINVANLTIDGTHIVNDTVSNMRALTNSQGWIGNAGVQSSFRLVGDDTITNLVNPSSTAYLAGLSLTTLQGNVTVSASAASSLAGVSNTIHFDRGVNTIEVQDSVAHLLTAANSRGVAIADVVKLLGPDQADAIDTEALLRISHFSLDNTLTVIDSSTNLLDGTLGGLITASGFANHIHLQLAGPEVLDADTAESLVSLPGFADVGNLTISDDPSYLLNTANFAAEQAAVSVTLAGDETVSANTVLRLSQVPHFTPGTSHLVLTGNDFADSATLKAVADMGSHFQNAGHSLTMTTDVLNLTPTEYAALQSDGLVSNGHVEAVLATNIGVVETNTMLTMSGTGIVGGTVHIYGADGTLISANMHPTAGFTVSTAVTGSAHDFSLTELVGANAREGAPVVVLDMGQVESMANAAGGTFASTGMIEVEAGKFLNLYQAGSVPILAHAALVYDPTAHTISLEGPGVALTTLITLGGTSHPVSLDASEILFKPHG